MTKPKGRKYERDLDDELDGIPDVHGRMNPSEPEESFEAWSRRQIEKIQAIITDEVFNRMGQRISRLESMRADGRLLERVTALENGSRLVGTGGLIAEIMDRLSKLETDRTEMARAIDSISEELAGTDKAVASHNERRLGAIEHKADWIQETGAEAYQRLDDRIGRFVSTIDEVGDRLRRLESQTEFETSEDDARLREGDRRIRGLESMMAQVYLRMEAYGIPHHGTVKAPEMAVQNTEAPSGGVVEPKTQTTICDEHKAQYFSSGYEAGKKDALDRSNDFGAQDVYDEGFSAGKRHQAPKSFEGGREVGRAEAMLEAADRLREWMGPAFSQATTDAAVRVVQGESLRRPIKDNPQA